MVKTFIILVKFEWMLEQFQLTASEQPVQILKCLYQVRKLVQSYCWVLSYTTPVFIGRVSLTAPQWVSLAPHSSPHHRQLHGLHLRYFWFDIHCHGAAAPLWFCLLFFNFFFLFLLWSKRVVIANANFFSLSSFVFLSPWSHYCWSKLNWGDCCCCQSKL